MKDGQNEQQSPRPYPGEKARQGRIVLNTPGRRRIFIAGLVGIVVLVLLTAVFA